MSAQTKPVARPQPEVQAELKKLIEEAGAVRYGHFVLASLRHSDVYVEKFRVLERPELLASIAGSIAQHFAECEPDLIVGPATGGILVAYEVARQLGRPAVYVEAENKQKVLRRGASIPAGSKVLLVDDVLTTGISLRETLQVISDQGATVIGIGVLIDRSEQELDFPCELFAATRFEASTYAPDEVPEWLQAVPITTPGTRASQAG